MDLYKNWDVYAKQYSIDKFYDVDKKQFLKELTNFSYSFAKYFITVEIINKLEKSIDNLQQVNLKFQNWKVVNNSKENLQKEINVKNDKWYITIGRNKRGNPLYNSVVKFNSKWDVLTVSGNISFGNDNYYSLKDIKSIYRWDGTNEPQTPDVDKDTGSVIFWTDTNYQNTRSFLLKYINAIVQENIRVQQGGNLDYDDPNLGSQRIIFDFEIINNLNKSSIGTILTKKSIYRMILTIDERKNIIAGSLELTHLKQYWNGYDYNNYRYTDDLGFLFSFMKDKGKYI